LEQHATETLLDVAMEILGDGKVSNHTPMIKHSGDPSRARSMSRRPVTYNLVLYRSSISAACGDFVTLGGNLILTLDGLGRLHIVADSLRQELVDEVLVVGHSIVLGCWKECWPYRRYLVIGKVEVRGAEVIGKWEGEV